MASKKIITANNFDPESFVIKAEEDNGQKYAVLQLKNDVVCLESSQTLYETVDESIEYRHMIDNPFQEAVKEHKEREEVENQQLESGGYDSTKHWEQLEEIKKLNSIIEKLKNQNEQARKFHADIVRRYRESGQIFTGYDIKMRNENSFDVLSIYDRKNSFPLEYDGNEMSLLDTQYANSWKELLKKYLHEHDSLDCFMSPVTLKLHSRQYEQQTNETDSNLL